MKIIKDGDCYNQELEAVCYGDKMYYKSIIEPTENRVLDILQYKLTTLQDVNWFLMKNDKGFILEYNDSINILHSFGLTYLDFIEWIKDEYLNKRFSWQKGIE
jgi:hypothetical protein